MNKKMIYTAHTIYYKVSNKGTQSMYAAASTFSSFILSKVTSSHCLKLFHVSLSFYTLSYDVIGIILQKIKHCFQALVKYNVHFNELKKALTEKARASDGCYVSDIRFIASNGLINKLS